MKKPTFTRLDAVVLLVVIFAGLIHLPQPFDGDQALFTVGAAKINAGAVLYRDFWDLKQPGIFGFYLLAGRLFGFNEVGVHLFELIYLLALSVVLLIGLRGRFESRAVASLVPLLTVGVYYAVTGSWHLTQVEGLVGFPMFLALWFASRRSGDETRRRATDFFLSGLAGGVVLLFKFLFLPVLVTFWLAAFSYAVLRNRERPLKALARISLPVFFGLLIPLVAMVAYFARFDALPLLSYTFFEYPARAVREIDVSNWERLIEGLIWLLTQFAPLAVFAFLWAWTSLRKDAVLIEVNLVLWIVVGLGVIFLQRLSWWEYHYMLLFVPLGILAARGIDLLWGWVKQYALPLAQGRVRVALTIAVALVFLPMLISMTRKGITLARSRFALQRECRLKYQALLSPGYKTALSEAGFLSDPNSLRGDIYICGNPIYYILSGRGQAIASNGWSLELFLPEQWTQLSEELDREMPPYLFISREYSELIPKRSSSTAQVINQKYRVLRQSDAGTWYVVRQERAPDGSSELLFNIGESNRAVSALTGW